jgi:all-trans-8'-apo-beta-carotenal 15,15'-oxygenase
MKAYAAGYKTVFEEVSCLPCQPSEGEIPADLVGSYYRSGPAMFSAGSILPPKTSLAQPKLPPVPDGQDPDRMVRHPMEGDGGILGVTFSPEGQVTTRFRYVRTTALNKERKRGVKKYTGMEATRDMGAACAGGLGNFDWQLPLFRHHLMPGLNKLRKNTSNTRPIYWGKRLMSLWEGGQPYKLDAVALSTEGKSRLGGAIRRPDDPFGGQLVYDSVQNRALAYGVEHDARATEITLYEFDESFRLVGGKAGRSYASVPGVAIVNDMAVTRNYAIFVQPPFSAGGFSFLVDKNPGKALTLENGPATLHLIPRLGSEKQQQALSIPLDSNLVDANLLFCNSYEENDKLIIDAVRPESPPNGKTLPTYPWVDSLSNYRAGAGKKGLWRYTVDLGSTNSVTKKCLVSDDVSFATINREVSTQRHRYIYYLVGALGDAVSPPQGIARYDAELGTTASWMPETYQFCGEPMYAPRTGSSEGTKAEDDGYIMSVLFDGKAEESVLLILLANQIEKGPIARIPLGFACPHGLFGVFTADPEASWPTDVIGRRAKLADKMEARGNNWNEVKSDFAGLGLRLDDMEEYFPNWEFFD